MGSSTLETHQRRLLLVAALFLAFGTVLMSRLVQWQIMQHDQLTAWADARFGKSTVIEPKRGSIYDRNGRLLAVNLLSQYVVGDPAFFFSQTPQKQNAILSTASVVLSMTVDQLLTALKAGSGSFAPVTSTVSVDVARRLDASIAYPAFATFSRSTRFYPAHALVAHTVGFANATGDGIGIEGYYGEYLKGVPGQKLMEGRTYGQGMGKIPVIMPAQDGADITLTVDINIQYKAERELELALAAEGSSSGSVIVMDPRTGEILAMAGRPTFDLNDWDAVPTSYWNNPAITEAWEPGSIMKILTFAAALDAGKISSATTLADRIPYKYHGVSISNMDNKSYGNLTPPQALGYSSNIVTVKVADVLSTTSFYTYMTTAFGVGTRTGIDLAGEASGLIRLPVDPIWHISDLATHSYGQGLTVTPIQMTAAVAAIANKGIMMRPYVVQRTPGVIDSSGGPGPLRRSVKAETAATMTEWLVEALEMGAKQAQVPGYRLAGKTGTALIPPPTGTYSENETIASFVGYGPAENPRFVILVRIDRPLVHHTGAEVAAPVFRNIAQWLLTYLKIPPSSQQAQR